MAITNGGLAETTSSADVLAAPPIAPEVEMKDADSATPAVPNGTIAKDAVEERKDKKKRKHEGEGEPEKKRKKHDGETAEEKAERKAKRAKRKSGVTEDGAESD